MDRWLRVADNHSIHERQAGRDSPSPSHSWNRSDACAARTASGDALPGSAGISDRPVSCIALVDLIGVFLTALSAARDQRQIPGKGLVRTRAMSFSGDRLGAGNRSKRRSDTGRRSWKVAWNSPSSFGIATKCALRTVSPKTIVVDVSKELKTQLLKPGSPDIVFPRKIAEYQARHAVCNRHLPAAELLPR